jgi:hypothetical protein
MADITIRPQVKSLLAIVTLPARLRLPAVDHFGRLVLFMSHKGNRVAFRAIEAHGFNMGIMAESDLPNSLDGKLDISPADPSHRRPGKKEYDSQKKHTREFFHFLPPYLNDNFWA